MREEEEEDGDGMTLEVEPGRTIFGLGDGGNAAVEG